MEMPSLKTANWKPITEQADAFSERLLASNPFERKIVSEPSQIEGDVATIHAAAFEQVQRNSQEALERGQIRGLMVLGEPGVGKSHLLARVARKSAIDGDCFIYLHNIQVRPDDLPRYLLKCCVSKLADRRDKQTYHSLLYKIVAEAIEQAAKLEGLSKVGRETFAEIEHRLCQRLVDVEPEVFRVLFKYFYAVSKFRDSRSPIKRLQSEKESGVVVRWLKGDVLDLEEARLIGLQTRPDTESVEMGDHQIHSVLCTISRLAAESKRKFILCFDQCDNLQRDTAAALGRFLLALLRNVSATNITVIVAGVREEMEVMFREGVFTRATLDSFDSQEAILFRPHRHAARQILQARLKEYFDRFPQALKSCEVNRIGDELFPLGSAWFDSVEPDAIELRPRDLLQAARDRWIEIQRGVKELGSEYLFEKWEAFGQDVVHQPKQEVEQPGAVDKSEQMKSEANRIQLLIDTKIQDKLTEALNLRRLEPGQLPADAGNLTALVMQLLSHCKQSSFPYSLVDVFQSKSNELTVTESVEGRTIVNRVRFLVTGSANSAAVNLRQLLHGEECDHRILVTDLRCPLPSFGTAGTEYFQNLKALGPDRFRLLPQDFIGYATLDAMLGVVGDAKSGDIEVEIAPGLRQTINPSNVVDYYHRHDLYRQHPLLREFLTESVPAGAIETFADEEDSFRKFVVSRLDFLMGANLVELTKIYLADMREPADVNTVLPEAREIVLRMHNEGLIRARPLGSDLYVVVGAQVAD